MTQEQAEAFAVLLGGSAYQDGDWDWHVVCADGDDDEEVFSTFEECLCEVALRRDFKLVPCGEG